MATPSPFSAERLEAILAANREFRSHVVPLCAAETPMSEYARSFLSDPIHERYAMGGPLQPAIDNFIGAEFVLDLHQLTIDLAREIFGVRYADPRPHSGTGAITNLLMTLSEPGQRVLLQTTDSGGHASMAPICRRLGLEIVDLPYDFDRFDIKPSAISKLNLDAIDFVLIAPSDILYPPELELLELPEHTTLIYDATQTLGLIASGHLPSPFEASHRRLVVCGGTHKTLPGPSSGLLLTDNEEIAERLDAELSPRYVRHSHPHHMASLCATLIEHQQGGAAYSDRIRRFVEVLSAGLLEEGLFVLERSGQRSATHQVFLHVPAADLDGAYERAAAAGVTLNKKRKHLFRNTGLRLGVQEIARYQWEDTDVRQAAELLGRIVQGVGTFEGNRRRAVALAARNIFRDPPQLRTA
jgi:glycine hydroxymethyltransferase